MSAIDVDKLLQPVSDDAPCGEDLEYDTAFEELGRAAATGVGDSMLEKGSDPEPPKWPDVAKIAEELLSRTKDLRVAMHLARARLNTDGVIGLADGIALMDGFLKTYWDDVHPLLDAEDDNDPTMRINSLAALGDSNGLIHDLREVPLVKGKRAGAYSLHDIRVAAGDVPAPKGTEPPESGIIDAAFQECELDELKSSAEAVSLARGTITGIDAFITEQVGATNNPLKVGPISDELKSIARIYADQLSSRGVDVEQSGDDDEASAGAGKSASGEIRSREDAVRMLDKISEYFRRNEPSSPVPMLLQRAKGLIAKDFMEILKDLTPDAISQAEMYSRSKDDG